MNIKRFYEEHVVFWNWWEKENCVASSISQSIVIFSQLHLGRSRYGQGRCT